MPFQPGQSGNPRGRPHKEHELSDRLRRLLKRKPEGKDVNYRDTILLALLKEAMGGNTAAIAMVFERVDGKVPDLHNINFTRSPEWGEMKTLIINILAAHPDSLMAFREAIAERERKLLGDKPL